MCGFAGIFNLDLTPLSDDIPIRAMQETLATRGPDDVGFYLEGPLALAHRRLSIIDLPPRGRQPIKSPCGRVVLAFNGEIYNFRSLRKELESLGYHFVTQTDSEVLAAALAQWREKALNRLVGMFALAAWFVEDKKLFLARDRTGIKSLVYQQQGDQLSFASEIKGLKPLWKQLPTINQTALHHYLSFGHLSDVTTMIEGISRLPAAHYLWVGNRSPILYWQPSFNQISWKSDFEDELRELMTLSMQDHLISDRPVGLMLSGGLDSSVMALLAARQQTPVKAFTLNYTFLKDHPDYNEAPFARLVAQQTGLPLEEVAVTEQDMVQNFEKVSFLMDEPNAGPAVLPYFCAYQKLKEQVTVVLDGGGADECFAGYRKYLVAHAWEKTQSWPAVLRQVFNFLGIYGSTGQKWLGQKGVNQLIGPQLMWDSFELKELLSERYNSHWTDHTLEPLRCDPSLPLATQMQWLDLKNHMVGWGNHLLDQISMSQSMECRVPYQDHRLLEFVLSLKESDRIHWPHEKWLLKKTFKDLLPKSIVKRRKQGLGSPLKHFLRITYRQALTDWLSSSRLKRQDLFDHKIVEKMIQETLEVKANHTPRLWPLLQFQMWWENLSQ